LLNIFSLKIEEMKDIKTIQADIGQVEGNIALLVTRWNSFITDNLLEGALRALNRNDIEDSQITIVRVPGAYELSIAALKLAESGKYSAIVALGCVIRGGTPHFEYVSTGCNDGLNQVQLKTGVPVTFGVLTVDNVDQAIERSGEDPNNKGEEAALTALEMIQLLRNIEADK
jgi:6,7-dimethyl-8-ribityllumazine synthase